MIFQKLNNTYDMYKQTISKFEWCRFLKEIKSYKDNNICS